MGRLLKEALFIDASVWLKTLNLTDYADDRETAFSSTKEYLTDFTKLLKNLNAVTYKKRLPELEKFFSQPWRRFVNSLPNSFYRINNDLLTTMYTFTLIIKDIDSDLYNKMIRQMIEVRNIDDGLREGIMKEYFR